jgi:ABC-type bacteriocin/lantibiotic exporter with double-glycine peptidase domain
MSVRLFIFSLPFFLYACAPSEVISGSGKNRIIEGIPFYAQEANQCGPASLAGVMNFWKVGVSPSDIAKEIYSASARGTLNIDMVLYPQGKGLVAEQYSGGMDDLRKKIDEGFPLIVLVDKGLSVLEAAHFMVIVGYWERGVVVNSGREGGEFISEKDFLETWRKMHYWTLLIRPGKGE